MTIDDRAIARLRLALDAPDLEEGRYRITGRLGEGGMGTVYLAEDRLLAREVALKVLHLEDVSDEGVERMTREAKILAQLEHPGIVPVHDLGRLPDGRVFYAMKRVRGVRLDRHVAGGVPAAERLRLFLKVCEAVSFAHAAGVLHRDLKPENIMVGEFGEVLILDWGVARWARGEEDAPAPAASAGLPALSPGSSRITQAGAVLGTPAYMAPEQARGDTDRIDRRTDVFGLGATLRFLLTERPPGPARVAGGVPAPLASICARALEPDPARRYDTVADLAADIERYLDGERVRAHREPPWAPVVRVARRYKVPIGLVLTYIVVRALLWIVLRR